MNTLIDSLLGYNEFNHFHYMQREKLMTILKIMRNDLKKYYDSDFNFEMIIAYTDYTYVIQKIFGYNAIIQYRDELTNNEMCTQMARTIDHFHNSFDSDIHFPYIFQRILLEQPDPIKKNYVYTLDLNYFFANSHLKVKIDTMANYTIWEKKER